MRVSTPRGEEADRLQPPRIGGVENRHAIAEHVADVDVAAVDHDLHAVGPAALIAVRQVPDPAPDAWRRDDCFSRLPQSGRADCSGANPANTNMPLSCSRRVYVRIVHTLAQNADRHP